MTYVFTAGALGSKLELLQRPSDLLRLIIPVATVMLVFLLRNAARQSRECHYAISLTDVILAAVATLFGQFVLIGLMPELAMPRWAPTQGGFVGSMLVTMVRTLFPQGPEIGVHAGSGNTPRWEELRWLAFELHAQVSQRNMITVIAALIVAGASIAVLAHSATARIQIAFSGIFLFALTVLVRMPKVDSLKTSSVEFSQAGYRAHLIRQRRFLRSVFCGCATLLLPATILLLYGSHVYEFSVVLCLLVFGEIILRKADRFEGDLRRLEIFESSTAGIESVTSSRQG